MVSVAPGLDTPWVRYTFVGMTPNGFETDEDTCRGRYKRAG